MRRMLTKRMVERENEMKSQRSEKGKRYEIWKGAVSLTDDGRETDEEGDPAKGDSSR